ncbi:hypothetical protein KC315_g13520, partial [Hortaea werneckii]
VAVVDVPPRAPTPPPAPEALPENVNVFDFLVSEETPKGSRKQVEAPNGARMVEEQRHYANGDSRYAQYSNGDGSQYSQYGFSYGHTPVQPGFQRYDSWNNMTDSQASQGALMPPPPPYVTPGPGSRREHKERSHKGEKSEKKRKRGHVEDLDLSSKRPASRGDDSMTDAPAIHGSGGRVLHSGLTGGLSKLVTDPEFYDDRIDAGPTPISPLKRTKREKEKDRDSTKDDRRKSSYTSYSTSTATKSSKHPEYREDKHARRRSRSKDRGERERESVTISKPAKTSTRHARSPSSSPEPHHHRSRTHGSSRHRDDHHHHHRPGSVQPSTSNQLTRHQPGSAAGASGSGNDKAALFLSFITKGPESERGCSVNKALKRYHREQTSQQLRITGGGSGVGGSGGGGDEDAGELMDDKELWKSLRVRRNERGEVVLFVG